MAKSPPSPFSFVLIGAGRVGTAVAVLLQRAGHRPVGVSSRTKDSAQRASERLDCPVFELDASIDADVVLIGAPDGAIGEVAAGLRSGMSRGTTVVHFAGSLGLSVLESVVAAGGHAAALHPVQACPDVDTAIARLPGSAWGITCDEAIQPWARSVVTEDLDGHPVMVPEDARPLWHAAAVTTSNGIAALLATGESLLDAIHIESPEGVLGPLASGTIQNAIEGGGGAATLTGPIIRGETEVVKRHLDAIARAGVAAEPFLSTARMIVAAAAATGRVSKDEKASWDELLERP